MRARAEMTSSQGYTRPCGFSRRERTRVLALMLVLLGACGNCRATDAERAAKERAAIEEHIRDSFTLVPYRAFKLTLRANGEPNAPEESALLWKALAETRALPAKPLTEEESRRAARTYLDLAVAFSKARKTLQKRDEDEFPLLWSKWVSEQPPLWRGYDAGQEHAILAGLWLILDSADQSDRVPASELVFYELSRATPQPSWAPVLRVAVRANRGLSFCQAGYHYAAEEELNAFLSEAEALPVEEYPQVQGTTREQSRETLLAAGYFLRAWNRMALKREKAAEEDIERGLGSLEKLGVDNELTWWGWAFIHFRRERYEESAKYLDKLAGSPYLGEREQQELRTNAEEMRRHGGTLPIFQQTRAAVILAQALLARAGGLEHLLVTVLGPERAKQLYAPIAWMDRVHQGMGALTPEKVAHDADGMLDKAREAGGKGLDALKQRLRGDAGSSAEASQQ